MAKQSFSQTRLAPTPNGFLHLGNLYSFIITAGIARRHSTNILLRIDDIDQDRLRREFVEDIFDTLHFFQLPWDDGPLDYQHYQQHFSQLKRIHLYREALDYFLKNDLLFACDCSRSMLDAAGTNGYSGHCLHRNLPFDAPGVCWRIKTSQQTIRLHVYPFGEKEYAFPQPLQYFIVQKKDGYPSYQLCSVIDDRYFNIDLVVRGDDLLPSTLAQQWLHQLLPRKNDAGICFYHHPLLRDASGRKLSKSSGDTSIRFLKKAGKSRSEILTLVSKYAGIKRTIDHWEELYELAMQQTNKA